MSFVGTRPEVTKYVKKYTKEMRARITVWCAYNKYSNIIMFLYAGWLYFFLWY